ncbi:hypothetical protein EDF81_4772 [Enterobacter sp. BIGb0383]|uniref:putative T6SS immunity periplasmic lipoprotein n=1 Tax=unclassified Enterobacter TaxID=2608935 RepID=UPI000F46D9C7|nr:MULTISPECIES: putative T6SS immunity periplasmic lipoprotein [unclassified Enterobacter]ROP48475.1 hypothetical protein EDF81_4772 [Enterobacter sp. BIGb0383]ROS00387.1 hypothetical protein EC848_4782 [Enterobacter sp. BIGb0359]
MVMNVKRITVPLLCVFISMLAITGCPEKGYQLRFDEEGVITVNNGNVCFPVPDSAYYRVGAISINPRGTPSKDEKIIFDPALNIVNEHLCIPPTFYQFDRDGSFFIRAILISTQKSAPPRKIVSALEVEGRHITSIRPDDSEMARPYSEMLRNQ